MRRELDARFQELNGILEQRMQRLEALIAPAQAAPDTAEAAPAANFAPALEEPAPEGQPQEPVQEAPPVVIPALAQVGEPVYERFRRQKPPTFNGSHDPVEAEDWLKKIQRIFAYMKLEDHEKLAYAVNQLEREALCWWEYVVMAEGEENATWTFFVDSFREKYLGEAQLSGKIQEFMNLKQGKMTVTEYVTKFTELARFAPTIVPIDDARKRKFMLGLRVEVAKQIDGGSHGPRSYADAVQRALRNESWDRIEPKTAPNKEEMALVPIERSTPSGVKRSYEAPAEGSHDFGRYNFRSKKFSRRSDRDRIRNRWSENRARGSSGRNALTGGIAQSTP